MAFAKYGDPDYTISVTDSVGNTYEQAATATCYEHGRTYIFAAYDVTALPDGSDITITHTDVDGATVAVASVFRGLAEVDPLDQSLGNPVAGAQETISGTTPTVGPTGTTTQANELLIGAIGTEGPVGDAPGPGRMALRRTHAPARPVGMMIQTGPYPWATRLSRPQANTLPKRAALPTATGSWHSDLQS